jgi:hypothetical protein
VKLSTGQAVVLVGGVGLVGLYLMRRPAGASPFSLGEMFDTLMPNAPDQQQIADWFAARSGRTPSPAGTAGYGATSSMPAYAGGIAQLGNAIANLFTRSAGPGNQQGANQPRASSSSGGGVAQPVPGITLPIFQGQLYLPNTDWSDHGINMMNIDSGIYEAPAGIYSQGVSQGIPYGDDAMGF